MYKSFRQRFIFYLVILGSTLIMGVFFVYSSLYAMKSLEGLDPELKLFNYIIALSVGISAGIFMFYFGERIIKGSYFLPFIFIIHIGLLYLPHMYSSVANVNRWIDLGFIQFQPSELSKILLPAIITYIFYKEKNNILKYLYSSLSIAITIYFIFIQPDLSTSIIVLSIGIFTIFLNLKNKREFIVFSLIIFILFFAVFVNKDLFLQDYQMERVLGQDSFQTEQSRKAIENGGIIGTAPFGGMLKYNVPASYADFIMSIIGEEWGKVGIILVLTLFFILSREMTRLSYFTRDQVTFSYSTAIAFFIFLQMAINALVGLGVPGIPVTGVTLPLMSYGNSSLMMTLASIGLAIGLIYYNGIRRINDEGEDIEN
ncbi:FtsW/RodA/SpoVE family cell cycle protein [Geotoga petraea]|uniref:Probable peptidoglycan glycosyltransferase FtsW n=1 Tax=Geotoga petraea TaxID=28234 RepID=A0A1G6NKP0_9BACT|nr:FtsW/RodA/SpoVE family cell cycle protein [Geotoga petraea]SDC68510.1 cell division protein FtsW [Geotoga petraea]